MRAMILAAGRGQRMRELTAEVPKPLLRVKDYYLIEYAIYALANIGVQDIVINICYRGEQIKKILGNGARYGVAIYYSEEKEALETGGGICQALPLLGSEPFIVLSSDVITDYPLEQLPKEPEGLAHLVLVDNPIYYAKGDFSLEKNKVISKNAERSHYTFGNIGIYRPELFANCQTKKFRLGMLLHEQVSQEKITGEYYQGIWYNLGTPEELNKITVLPDIRREFFL